MKNDISVADPISKLNPGLFGKLGSDFDGERLAALRALAGC